MLSMIVLPVSFIIMILSLIAANYGLLLYSIVVIFCSSFAFFTSATIIELVNDHKEDKKRRELRESEEPLVIDIDIVVKTGKKS